MSEEYKEGTKKECCPEMGHHMMGFRKMGFRKFGHGLATMSVEEEVRMLEKVKKVLEAKLANVDEKLAKLKK
jgi:hypothetical protein